MAFTLAAQNGLLAEFLPINDVWSARMVSPAGFTLTLVSLTLFMRRMLKTRILMPRLDRWLKTLLVAHLLLLSAYAAWPAAAFGRPTQTFYILSMVFLMGVALACAFKRQRSAYFFVAAFVILFAAGVVTSLAGLGAMPANAVAMNALQIGSAMEMLLLAFALADRFITLRREKEAAQGTALEAQRQLVDNLRQSERLLEDRVAQRTAELQASLRDLQTTQARLVDSERHALAGQRAAREALADQRQFVAMISHEFRSPLAVIDAAVQLLSVKLQDAADTQPVLARIRRGVARLSGFIENCLTEDSLDSEGMTPHPATIDLTELATAIQESAQFVAERQRIVVELAPGLPSLRADPQLLGVMLLNLLDNAIKYSPADSEVKLRIGQDGPDCRLEVIDRGPGIPSDEQAAVFRKYLRGRNAQSISGAGLGLSLVARIVDLHGGRIELDSRLGEGTRVAVMLPLQ
jgi:signal transduction histidine kinase